MILPAGSFKTSDYRKAIPAAVEREVRRRYELDHDPALANRAYDTEAGDFIPPQHDASKIFLKEKALHDEKTFGRKAGAAKTVTTRNSDVGEAAHTRDIRDTELLHQAAMIEKAGDRPRAEAYRGLVRKSRLKPRRKIPSRPFSKQKRPLRSRSFQRKSR
jgi:hypothetical protein